MTRRKSIGLALIACVAVGEWLTGSAGSKPHAVHFKGELRTDGQLTVGRLETLALKGMPPRISLYVAIVPPDI